MDLQHPVPPNQPYGTASPPPYDPLLPAPTVSHHPAPSPTNQVTTNNNPVSMDTPTETPHDLFCLAKEYERRGRLPDAANLYLKASMNGHLGAMVSYAAHLVPSDERAAFVWFRAAAERGDPRAWAELGQLLARGRYFEVNAIDAARCWKRAAQMGDNSGKSALGLCYIRGFGVKQDPEKGVEIVRQVADVHNDVTAMKNLAWIYRHGKGVPKNLHEAEYWDNRAKKQEKIMAHLASREQALFGKGRSSRTSRYKNRDLDPTTVTSTTSITTTPAPTPVTTATTDPTTAAAAAATAAASATAPPAAVSSVPDQAPLDSATQDLYKSTVSRPYQKVAKSNILVEEDIENRLRHVSEDPSRRADTLDKNKAVAAAPAATAAGIAATAAGTAATVAVTAPETRTTVADKLTQLPSQEATSAAREGQVEADAAVGLTAPAASADSLGDIPGARVATETEPYADQTTVREKPIAPRGAAVADLSFVQKPPPDHLVTTSAEDTFGISASEIRAVQETATRKATARKQAVSSSTPEAARDVIEESGEAVLVASRRDAVAVDESVEDQFITPEQSLDNDESAGAFKATTAAAAAGGAGAGAAVGLTAHSRGDDEREETSRFKATAAAAGAAVVGAGAALGTLLHSREGDNVEETGATGATGEDEHRDEHEDDDIDDDDVENTNGDTGAQRVAETNVFSSRAGDRNLVSAGAAAQEELSGVEGRTLEPGVRSKAMFFENQAAKADGEGSGEPSAHRGASYSLARSQGGLVEQRSSDLEEFEQDDMAKAAASVTATSLEETTRPGYKNTVSCSITRVSSFPKDTHAQRPKSSGYPGEAASLAELQERLSLYPRNPLRADSQVPLYNFLHVVQSFPVSNTEAYGLLEKGHGFPKVVVAMIAQHEDEAIQEQGLHAFVRIVRASQASLREKLILMSYGDCFRKVQGNEDAVIPKGSLGIDERGSGAIQAIVYAMRGHESVRRVRLAGCAALGEVASVSSSCRSIAYENGAVNLLLACLRHRSSRAASAIHDMSCRAIASFCGGKENFAFKEAFTNAGAIPEILSVLQLWGHSDDVKSELVTTVTKSTCTALRHITDGCAVASSQCVQSFAYHHLVRVMVLHREDVSVCTLVVSALTTITRNAGSIAEKGLLDAKPLQEVLVTMQTHSNNPLFIRKSLDFMESLGSFSSMRDEIVMAGGIPFAADIIRQGGNDSLLLERACGVVEKLCRGSQKNQEMFAESNGVKSLTVLLNSHQGLPTVAERALLALTSVCASNPDNQSDAVKAGSPDELVRVLSAYSSKNAKVVAATASAMAALVVPKNAPVAQTFAQLKAPELVVRAMKRHPDSVSVQENGSAAISAFCEADPRIISSLLKSGISSILVVALQRFLHKQSAVVQVVRAMRAITNEANPDDSYRFKSKLLTDRSNESSLPEIFHTALAHHKKSLPDTANVIISICATINRLCMRSVAFKNEVGKDGIVEELKRLVERTAEYRDLGALQPVLATICTLVLESEDNKNRFHAAGGVEAILDVMQKWKSDTYVLEHCCAALRYSCNDHFGNCDKVKHHNGVRSILGVMELHPENVNVTLWCCLTLADLCKGDEELQSSPNVVQGIRKVVSAMSMFSNNSRFLASACEFLRAASVDNAENQERIVRLGGRAAIVKALETHHTDNTLTESGAYALLQIQDVADARVSVDSGGSFGLVKRLSRDLRRSGSNSSKSNKGGKGRIGRKSLSFSSRRRQTDEAQDADRLVQTAPEETPATKPSLINFSRGSRGNRRRSSRSARKAEIEELPDDGEVHHAADGYEDFEERVEGRGESDPQLDA